MPTIINAIATNRWIKTVGWISDEVFDTLRREWSFSVGNPFMMKKYPGWNGRIQLYKHKRLPSGLFWATRKMIEEKYGIRFKVVVKAVDVPIVSGGQFSDRAYQNNCVDRMLARIRYGGGLILNATGTGKTRIAGIFCSRIKGSVCFIVDQLDLLEQGRKELAAVLGEKVGYVGNSIYDPRRVTVATIQTLHKHHSNDGQFRKWFSLIDIGLVDELHVQMARRNFGVLDAMNPKAVFGLTATLELQKKEVRLKAYAAAGPVCFEYGLEQGMEEYVLAAGVIIRILYPNLVEVD